MTRPCHPTPLSRTTLGVTGLALAVSGSWLLTSDRLPSWWPGADTGTVLLDPGQLTRLHAETWWAPTTTATAITLTLVFALTSLRQLRPTTARHLPLPALRAVTTEAPHTTHTTLRLSATAHRTPHVR